MAEPKVEGFRPASVRFALYALTTLGLAVLNAGIAQRGLALIEARRAGASQAALEQATEALFSTAAVVGPLAIVNIVLIAMWLYRAEINARVHGGRPLRFSPAAAIASVLLPVANIVLAYPVLRELWERSLPSGGRGEAVPLRGGPSGKLLAWWVLWIVAEGASAVALVRVLISVPTGTPVPDYAWLDFIGDAASVPSALATLLVVWAIQRRQSFIHAHPGAERAA